MSLAPVVDTIIPADSGNIIAMFEHMLERAKAGEIVAAIVITEVTGRAIGHAFQVEHGDSYRLLGALESCKRRLVEERDL